jgi:serine/threonine protein kinase
MAVPLELFVKHLEDSGILAGDTLKDFIPPKAYPKDAEELLRELLRQKKLTKFQAEQVWQGEGKSLVLGNYLLLEKIGAGGMGQVFKAQHRRMDRIVAIKMLPVAMTKDQPAIARFEREVKAGAKLEHPNIVTAHDADQANGVHFLVMQYVEGSDLSALVKQNGPFPVEKAVNYILQAAKGLEFAHKKGVVHRDIKPANLLLDSEGTIKILDMGLARIESVGDAAPQADLTNTGAVMGTVDYMAPEQALDTKTADARADIYALGCSLFYLLTGKAIYDGDTLMKKLVAHREQPIPSIRSVRAEVPEQVEAAFKKMVAKKTEDRNKSMTEVIAALEGGRRFQEQTLDKPMSIRPSAVQLIWAGRSCSKMFLWARRRPFLSSVSTSRPYKGKRKLLPIGAATVLVAILSLAGFVWLPYQREKRIEREITSVGGQVYFEYCGPKWIPQSLQSGTPLFSRISLAYIHAKDVPADLISELGSLANLTVLGLEETNVTDAELVHLKDLTRLISLDLRDTKVTDAGLVHLKHLTGLREVLLSNRNITADGVATLRRALPNCRIYRE